MMILSIKFALVASPDVKVCKTQHLAHGASCHNVTHRHGPPPEIDARISQRLEALVNDEQIAVVLGPTSRPFTGCVLPLVEDAMAHRQIDIERVIFLEYLA